MFYGPETQNTPIDPWERLPAGLKTLIRSRGVTKHYDADEVMMGPGDRGDRIRLILAGRGSIVLRERGHREISVETLGPGDLFGEISFFTGKPSPTDWELIADEPCEVMEISAEDFDNIIREDPEVSARLFRNLARKIVRLDRSLFEARVKKRALQTLISREGHAFPEFVIGPHFKRRLADRMEELTRDHGPVLILGETGVGREVMAGAIFKNSTEFTEVFILLDIERVQFGWDRQLQISDENGGELAAEEDHRRLFFGSEELDERGMKREKPGYLEMSEEGTLLVRGVEHLSPNIQKGLLAAVQTGRFRRAGSSIVRKARFRLIATAKIDPDEITEENHPLIHGLMDRSIVIPPLRERRREIPDLAEHYLEKHSRELRKPVPELPKQTLKTLLNYSWPGNDLELSNTIRRAILVAEGGVVRPRDIYFEVKRPEGQWKFDLFRVAPVRKAVLSPLFPAILQSAVTPFFFILLALLFLGPLDPETNPASLFSWAVGWPALVAGALLWARFWCTLCPMGTLGKLAKKVIALEKPFPSFLKNQSDYLVPVAVLFIIWLETATHMRSSPFNLALLLLTITTLSVVVSVIFERQSWCRYLCPLGGMTGVMAKASMTELRADRKVCAAQCSSHECYFGTAGSEGCPYGHVTPTLQSNLDCKLCGQCVKNCPHAAISLNLRVPGEELVEMHRANTGTAFLVVGLLAGLLSELASGTDAYQVWAQQFPLPEIVVFTGVFTAIVVAVNLLTALAAGMSSLVYHQTVQENYARFGMALLPLVLCAFLAFHAYYLINLGVRIPMLVGQNFDLAVFRQLAITVPPEVTHSVQNVLLYVGLFWTLLIIRRLGKAMSGTQTRWWTGVIPHAAVAVVFMIAANRAIGAAFYG